MNKKSTIVLERKRIHNKFMTANKYPQASQIQKNDRIVTYKMPNVVSALP